MGIAPYIGDIAPTAVGIAPDLFGHCTRLRQLCTAACWPLHPMGGPCAQCRGRCAPAMRMRQEFRHLPSLASRACVYTIDAQKNLQFVFICRESFSHPKRFRCAFLESVFVESRACEFILIFQRVLCVFEACCRC